MKNIILILFSSFLLCTCSKLDNTQELPPATHNGANILACKINGKVFVASGTSNNVIATGVIATIFYDTLINIFAVTNNPHFEIMIFSKFSASLGRFQFGTDHFTNGAEYDDDTNGTLPTGGNFFNTDNIHSGYINYTYYDGKILAGTFAFDAVNGRDSVVHITEGRFDIANH